MADKRLNDIIEFINSLNKKEVFNIDTDKITKQGLTISGFYSYNTDHSGMISLYGETLYTYRILLNKLHKSINTKKKILNNKYIDDITKESMLYKFNNKDYVKHLSTKLLSSPNTFYVFLEVRNFVPLGRKPLVFNNCKFFFASEKKLKEILNNNNHDTYGIENHLGLVGKLLCEIKTHAIDLKTARENALNKLYESINLINFIGGVYKVWNPHVTRVFSPYYYNTVSNHITFIRDDENYRQSVLGWNQDSELDLKQLKSISHLFLLFLKIKRLSNLDDKNTFIKQLFIAIQWCGKSFFEERKEIAFNCCITALETILLANTKVELNYKLSLYTSYLAAENKVQRLAYFKKLKDLYSIRSEITHNGLVEIYDEDLEILRRITYETIKEILTEKKYNFLKSKNIEEFNKKLLKMVLS